MIVNALTKEDAVLIAEGWAGLGYLVMPFSKWTAARCFLISGKYYMKAYSSPFEVDNIVGPLARLIDSLALGDSP